MRNWIKSLDRVLKGEATRPGALRGGTIDLPVGGLTVIIVLLGAIYGACMGAFALITRWGTPTRPVGYLQMAGSAAKVPMLFFLTLVVTFPSLYVFNALVGSRLMFATVLRLLVAALGVLMAVLASFGTIVIFFSLCTTSYSFIVLLNVATFTVAGLLGMGFLLQTLHRLSLAQAIQASDELMRRPSVPPVMSSVSPVTASPDTQAASPAPPETDAPDFGPEPFPPVPPPLPPGALDRLQGEVLGRRVKTVFRIWVLVFGLVGAQMGWVLRPFIGNPHMPFTFFREREGSFFEAVIDRTVDLMSGSSNTTRSQHRSRSNSGSGWNNDVTPPENSTPQLPPRRTGPTSNPDTTDRR